MQEPSAYWADFERRLADLGAQPILIGALAAQEYRSEPRLTTDVDFLVMSLDGIAEAFRADGYEVREMAEPGAQDPYVIFIRGRGARVDALLVETPYQSEAHRRSVNGLLTVEDVIVHKLIAWRGKDQDDIESILATKPVLDQPYIERWAGEWRVENRWSEAKERWMAR